MISRENEAALRERGTPYILGARLKSRSAAGKRQILDTDGYDAWGRGESGEAGSLRGTGTGGGRLIATHSPRRARKDERDRARRPRRGRRKQGQNGAADPENRPEPHSRPQPM